MGYSICCFENEFEQVRGAFEMCNQYYFNGELDIKVYPSSDAIALQELEKFNCFLVDLDLSPRGKVDGAALVKIIQQMYSNVPMGIITGATFVKDKLLENEIKDVLYLQKPFSFTELYYFLERIGLIIKK